MREETHRRKKLSHKRRLADPPLPAEILMELSRRVAYLGSPYHKRNPGDFGLIPPAQPRPDKTLCDEAGVVRLVDAIRFLREGVRRGTISETDSQGFPMYVWAVTPAGIVLEAKLTNAGLGQYHGYPLFEPDPFRDVVLSHWSER